MSPSEPPPSLEVTFEPEGFACVLRSTETLVTARGMRWLAAGLVVGLLLIMLSLGPIRLAAFPMLILILPALGVGAIWLLGRGLGALLGAPRTTRLQCTHDHVAVQVLVHGMLRGDTRIPLTTLRGCAVDGDGLLLQRHQGEPIRIPADASLQELLWVALRINELHEARDTFELEERSDQRTLAREAAKRLLAQHLRSEEPRG